MYHVYILKSGRDNSLYVGYTNEIERRLKEHNRGLVKYTKERRPWNLVYYESFVSLEDAKTRENNLKYFGKAFGQLKRRIKNSLNNVKGAGLIRANNLCSSATKSTADSISCALIK